MEETISRVLIGLNEQAKHLYAISVEFTRYSATMTFWILVSLSVVCFVVAAYLLSWYISDPRKEEYDMRCLFIALALSLTFCFLLPALFCGLPNMLYPEVAAFRNLLI